MYSRSSCIGCIAMSLACILCAAALAASPHQSHTDFSSKEMCFGGWPQMRLPGWVTGSDLQSAVLVKASGGSNRARSSAWGTTRPSNLLPHGLRMLGAGSGNLRRRSRMNFSTFLHRVVETGNVGSLAASTAIKVSHQVKQLAGMHNHSFSQGEWHAAVVYTRLALDHSRQVCGDAHQPMLAGIACCRCIDQLQSFSPQHFSDSTRHRDGHAPFTDYPNLTLPSLRS